MRSRQRSQDQVAEVARRRLELLSAELAGIRPAASDLPDGDAGPGPGEHTPDLPDLGLTLLEDRPWPGEDEVPPHRLAPWPDEQEVPPHRLAPWPDEHEEVLPDRWRPGDRAPVRTVAEPTPSGDRSGRPGGGSGRPGRHARRRLEAGALVGGWLHDRLPAPLQGRVRVGAAQLTVVAVAVALALGVTAWWVVRADRSGTPVPALAASSPGPTGSPDALVTPVADAAGPAPASPTASASASLVVDVTGKVRRPGIVTLPVGSRVVDALEAAGGARRGVRLDGLNLARVLTDGEQIVVGVPAPGGVAAPAASAPTAAAGGAAGPVPMVNINTADESQLETLPGVGPVTAQKILQWRTDNGPFSAVDDLLDVSGIGEATLAEMAPFVTL